MQDQLILLHTNITEVEGLIMIDVWMWISVIVCVTGCGWTSYRTGVRHGGAMMIDMLEAIGVVTVDDEDNVHPNRDYRPPLEK